MNIRLIVTNHVIKSRISVYIFWVSTQICRYFFYHSIQSIPRSDWYKIAVTFIVRKKFSGKSIDKKISWCINDRLEVEQRGCLERANGTSGDRLTLTHAVWYISILNQHDSTIRTCLTCVPAIRFFVYLMFGFAFFSTLEFVFYTA